MQMGGYKGPVDCVKQLVRTEGLKGLGRGMTGTLSRETFGNALFFTFYEVIPATRSNACLILTVQAAAACCAFCGLQTCQPR